MLADSNARYRFDVGGAAFLEPVVRAYDLLSGEVVREQGVGAVVLEPGERQQVGVFDVSGLPTPQTAIAFEEEGMDPAWRLLNEPKNTRLALAPTITVSTAEPGSLVIDIPAPVVDLMLTEEGSPAPFTENFITMLSRGQIRIATTRRPASITARSLAGYHKVVVTRSPF